MTTEHELLKFGATQYGCTCGEWADRYAPYVRPEWVYIEWEKHLDRPQDCPAGGPHDWKIDLVTDDLTICKCNKCSQTRDLPQGSVRVVERH